MKFLNWVMRGTLWSTGLLFSFFTLCTSLEEECVLGIVGRPVLLPCFHHEPLGFYNLSIEWRGDDEQLVLRAEWEDDGEVVIWSLNSATIPANAPLTGNYSLELPKVNPKRDKMLYSLFLMSVHNGSAPLCTVCLRTAASFSTPLLQREETANGNKTTFMCHSSGGFPEPMVYWLINDTEQPPEGSVRTRAMSLPDSDLYNITSHLTVNISEDSGVSCSIENERMNETMTSKSSGVEGKTHRVRASEGMWMFSTGLCVAVAVMVGAGLAYQIHLDRISKKRRVLYENTQRGRKRRNHCTEETEVTALGEIEHTNLTSRETCV